MKRTKKIKEFNLKKNKWFFPISVGKVYDNSYNTEMNEGIITHTDIFPILDSGKSKCYKSEKPISKMIPYDIL